jgi:glycyl-tRNA synthetase beta chain
MPGRRAFSTPRRLTLTVQGLLAGKPHRAKSAKARGRCARQGHRGFLRGAGLTRDDLEVRERKEGQGFFAVIDKPGRPAAEIVAEVLEDDPQFPVAQIHALGAGSLRWVRPLHSILCILTDEAGGQVVPLDRRWDPAGDTTRGHRFMAPDRFAVTSFEDYEAS